LQVWFCNDWDNLDIKCYLWWIHDATNFVFVSLFGNTRTKQLTQFWTHLNPYLTCLLGATRLVLFMSHYYQVIKLIMWLLLEWNKILPNYFRRTLKVCLDIFRFLFPALGGLLYGYDIGSTSCATISIEVCFQCTYELSSTIIHLAWPDLFLLIINSQ
jgi:uncharacterized membrane protein